MTDTPIRVMIVDDHAIVRGGLEYFLSATADIKVVAQADDGDKAVALCSHVRPDVVLMDLMMPRVDGIATTSAIRKICPCTQVIILTGFYQEDLVERALRAGAISYLLKDALAHQLVDAIRAAHAGKATLAPQVMEGIITSISHPPKLGSDLSAREVEVLNYMVTGLSNAQIAEQVIVSQNTVRHHVRSILSKLGVSNRTAAVWLAVRNRLVDQPSSVDG